MFGRQNQTFGSGRQVCKFFLEGRCRFGDSCKNEHPAGEGSNQRGRGDASNDAANSFSITTEAIKTELSIERPIWPLSCYAPGKNAPRQLIDSDLEHSPEEMRVMHYLALASGNVQASAQKEAELSNSIEAKVQAILADLNGAMKYVVDGKDQHPNRLDQVAQPFGARSATNAGSAFNGNTSQPTGFGQASLPAQSSAFGQPSALGGTSAFGKPSGLGQSSAFGQPSALGQASAFGQPSALGNAPAFGKPAFGQASQPSAFGAPSQLGGGTAFGQPSQPTQGLAFGQASQPGQTSAFGQPSQPGQASAFGKPSQPGAFGQAAPAFGQSGFAKPSPFGSNTTQSQSAFGQASNLGTNKSPFGAAAGNNNASPFAATAGTTNASPFAAAAAGNSTVSPFGAGQVNTAAKENASPFANSGGNTTAQSAFGQPSAPSPFGAAQGQQPTAFGQPSGGKPSPFAAATPAQGAPVPAQAKTQSPFGAPTTASTQQTGAHIGRDATGKPTTFKGRHIVYNAEQKAYFVQNARTGKPERIWFPDGPQAPVKDAEAPADVYNDAVEAMLKKLYLSVKETGVFQDGVVPEIPPKAEWVSFDL